MVMVLFVGDIASETCHNYLWHQGLTCSSYPAGQIVPCLDASTPPMVIPSLTHLRSAPIILSRPVSKSLFPPDVGSSRQHTQFFFFFPFLHVCFGCVDWNMHMSTSQSHLPFLFTLSGSSTFCFVSFASWWDLNVRTMLRLNGCVVFRSGYTWFKRACDAPSHHVCVIFHRGLEGCRMWSQRSKMCIWCSILLDDMSWML